SDTQMDLEGDSFAAQKSISEPVAEYDQQKESQALKVTLDEMDSDTDRFSAQPALSEVEEQLCRQKEEGIASGIIAKQPALAPLCVPVLSPEFVIPQFVNPSPDLISPPCPLP